MTSAAKYFIQWLDRHADTFQNNICFFGGSTEKSFVYPNMKVLAERLKCEWIDTLLDRAHIQKDERPNWSREPEDMGWKQVSRALAKHARGKVKVVLGECINPRGVWETAQLKSLRKLQQTGLVATIEMYPMNEAGELGKPVLSY